MKIFIPRKEPASTGEGEVQRSLEERDGVFF